MSRENVTGPLLPLLERAVVEALYAVLPLRKVVARIAPARVLRRWFPLVLRRGYKDFNSDRGVPRRNFASDFELYQAAEMLGTVGTFNGQDALPEVTAELRDTFDALRFAPEAVTTVHEHLFVFTVRFVAVGRESGVPVDRQIAHVWTRRGGRVSRLEVYWTPAEALEAVGLSE